MNKELSLDVQAMEVLEAPINWDHFLSAANWGAAIGIAIWIT